MITFTFEAESLSNYSFHICDIELATDIETVVVAAEEYVNGLPEILEITFLDEDDNEISYREGNIDKDVIEKMYKALYKAIDKQIELDKEEFEIYQAGY